MPTTQRFILAGNPASSQKYDDVTDKYTGKAAFRVARADRSHVEKAIAAGVEAEQAVRAMPAFARAEVLHGLAAKIEKHGREFEKLLCIEAGKPLRDARGEIDRALTTCRLAAEEATRLFGEYLPLDISPRNAGYEGIVKHVPVGLCSFITPFNFPLNLVMHKIAPAIACGCPFILKPAPQTPVTALRLGELLMECDPPLPPGTFSILPLHVEDAAPLVEDDRIKLLSFTGSAAVGWSLKSKAGRKKVVLELGGNAAGIVDEGVDVPRVAERLIFGAFYQSGQSCISVQRLLVHQSIYEALKRELVKRAKALKIGDPKREDTFLGPLISQKDVERVLEWIDEAKRGGAKILCDGTPGLTKEAPDRARRFLSATIVENPPRTCRLWREEAFGPVLTIESFDDFDDALASVNDTRYGLQAGVFTNSFEHALRAWDALQVGGVVINDVPSARVDSMPYGGVKDSGLGREGVRYAIEEMTERRLMLLHRI
jgi:acyl-CoA reductase-like NAD-dependent aldehyde dehydrogenase